MKSNRDNSKMRLPDKRYSSRNSSLNKTNNFMMITDQSSMFKNESSTLQNKIQKKNKFILKIRKGGDVQSKFKMTEPNSVKNCDAHTLFNQSQKNF